MSPLFFFGNGLQIDFGGIDLHVHESPPLPSLKEPLVETDITTLAASGTPKPATHIGVQGMRTHRLQIPLGAGEDGLAMNLTDFHFPIP